MKSSRFTCANFRSMKKDGVKYVLIGRINQKVPHNFHFYENFKSNEARLNIKLTVENL